MSAAANVRQIDRHPETPATADPVGMPAATQLSPIDQKESAGEASIARINFVAADVCQKLDALTGETDAFRQIVLQDAEQVQRAINLLVESGKAAAEFAAGGKAILSDLRSKRARLIAQREG